MGFYEPAVVLSILGAIYATTQAMKPMTKRRLLWWSVAAALAFSAAGLSYDVLRTGALPGFSTPE